MIPEPLEWRVPIVSWSRPSEEVYGDLCAGDAWSDEVSLVLETPGSRFRTSDPAVLVATIAAASSALTALLAGVLQRGAVKAGRRIVVELASGSKLEVPADIDPAELDRLIGLIDESPKRIILP